MRVFIKSLLSLVASIVIGLISFANSSADPNPHPGYPVMDCDTFAPYPFTGVEIYDNNNEDHHKNINCAGVASVFTWLPHDTSVNDGYERARTIFFAPPGWLNEDTAQPDTPLTHDIISPEHPLHMVEIWNQIHSAHHSAIAYTTDYPVNIGSQILVTQFEYPNNLIDHNGAPLPGSRPLRSRQWLVNTNANISVLFKYSDTDKIVSIYPDPEGKYQGTITGNKELYPGNPILNPPTTPQTPKQRWSCQHIYYQREHP